MEDVYKNLKDSIWLDIIHCNPKTKIKGGGDGQSNKLFFLSFLLSPFSSIPPIKGTVPILRFQTMSFN